MELHKCYVSKAIKEMINDKSFQRFLSKGTLSCIQTKRVAKENLCFWLIDEDWKGVVPPLLPLKIHTVFVSVFVHYICDSLLLMPKFVKPQHPIFVFRNYIWMRLILHQWLSENYFNIYPLLVSYVLIFARNKNNDNFQSGHFTQEIRNETLYYNVICSETITEIEYMQWPHAYW